MYNQSKGDIGEAAFRLAATKLGFALSKPDNVEAYDFISDWQGKLSRVQVKSCDDRDSSRTSIRFKISCSRGKPKRAYTRDEIDYLAVYIEPLSIFYILPIVAVERSTTINFFPLNKDTNSKYEQYREAWDFLK